MFMHLLLLKACCSPTPHVAGRCHLQSEAPQTNRMWHGELLGPSYNEHLQINAEDSCSPEAATVNIQTASPIKTDDLQLIRNQRDEPGCLMSTCRLLVQVTQTPRISTRVPINSHTRSSSSSSADRIRTLSVLCPYIDESTFTELHSWFLPQQAAVFRENTAHTDGSASNSRW